MCGCVNSHFSIFMTRFSLSNLARTLSMSASWSSSEPLVIINILSRKLNLLWMFSRVLSSVL